MRLAEAKQRRAEIENPAPRATPVPKPSMAERIDTIAGEVDEIDAVLQTRRKAALDAVGGDETRLPEGVRDELERIETFRRVHAEKLFETLL